MVMAPSATVRVVTGGSSMLFHVLGGREDTGLYRPIGTCVDVDTEHLKQASHQYNSQVQKHSCGSRLGRACAGHSVPFVNLLQPH